MYIVIPMRYKSFRTHIDLTGVKFLSDKLIFLTQLNAAYTKSYLSINPSMKNEKGVEVRTSPLRELLEKN